MTVDEYAEKYEMPAEMPEALWIAKCVSLTEVSQDEPFLFKTYRELKASDPFKFMARLESMEKSYLALQETKALKKKKRKVKVEPVMRLLDNLLKEWEGRK